MSARGTWRVTSAARFDAVAWNALNDATFRSPVLHADFVEPLVKHFGRGDERVAMLVRDDGTTDCALVATRLNPVVADSFTPSQAAIGLWLQRDGAAGLPPAPVMARLAAAMGPVAAMVGLHQIDPEHVARVDRDDVMTGDYIRTARVTVAGTFDDYWARRGKNLRSNMKKQRNKLDADGVALRFDCLVEPSRVAAAIADYGRLESAGWKAEGGTAVSVDNDQGRFYREVFERFAARGAARIHRCFYGDMLAAMDLCVVHAGTMVILKTAFDESIKGTSPAFLMRHDYLPAVFDERRYERIEFYGRVMDWHTKWTDEVRTLYDATVYRWPLVARLDAIRRARRTRGAAEAVSAPADASSSAS